MTLQLNMFESKEAAKTGINLAIDKAEKQIDNFSDKILELLRQYNPEGLFECSDFREYCSDHIDLSKINGRAFGSIMRKAMKQNIIQFTHVGKTKNVKAHGTNCNYYRKK